MPYKNPEQLKQYWVKNKTALTEHRKTLFKCLCGKTIQIHHRSRHMKTKKHLINNSAPTINEMATELLKKI